MSTKGLSALQNEELEEGFSDSDNDGGPAGRQEQAAEFGEEMSWLRQES
jgi:hypothetical protein